MKKDFKSYMKQWEDAAANAVGHGGVSMPSDAMPTDKHKKHKKRAQDSAKKLKLYDGRTKEGRDFVNRILARRATREQSKNNT